ncbi:phosphate/phosphite/phosphonate ABC transporter substrate-binding protein [candidate division CSSED10-310 bacterium]|uniref:Phosphate/phosphite/phosphonate ABC transporter substrate-binding protein n=1 Tax=candidate division CSSED10-310 bacterium TaxID=2855610 RepID=A0ABV6Z3P6_UNCC1
MTSLRQFLKIILLSLYFCSLFASSVLGTTLRFVFYNPTVIFSDNEEAIAAIRSLEAWLTKALACDVKGYYFQKESDLRHFMATSQTSFGFFDVRFFIENYAEEKMIPLLIPQRNKKTAASFYLIVRKDSGINKLQALKGKILATTRRGVVNANFFSNIIFEGLIKSEKYIQFKWVDTSKSALMALFYKEVDGILVDAIFYDHTISPKLNFKILFTSQKVIFAPLCLFNENITPDFRARLKQAFLQSDRNSGAIMFNEVLKIEQWVDTDHQAYVHLEHLMRSSNGILLKEPHLAEINDSKLPLQSFPIKIEPEALPVFALSEEP